MGSTLALWATIKFARHPAALPCVLLAIPLLFWGIILLGLGWDIQTASQHGWVLEGQVRHISEHGRGYFHSLSSPQAGRAPGVLRCLVFTCLDPELFWWQVV